MALSRSKALRKLSIVNVIDRLYDIARAASLRPHNISTRAILLHEVARKMYYNFRRYRKLIRHRGYRPADIADMIINQKGGAI